MRELESRLAVLHAEKEELTTELKRALAENARARGHVHSARREHEHELAEARARVADAEAEAKRAEAEAATAAVQTSQLRRQLATAESAATRATPPAPLSDARKKPPMPSELPARPKSAR